MENTINLDGGACLSDGVEALHTYGLCKETTWPYSDDQRFKETPGEHAYHEAVQHEASSYHQVEQSHAVCMVGYDESRRVWIMRNSWGPDWGDHGYFYLPYEYLTDTGLGLCHGDLWVICKVSNAPVSGPPPAIKPHRKHHHHSHHHF
eukprot:gene41037-50776_t